MGNVPPPPFQSTRPIRGATISVFFYVDLTQISIHAPHTGRDAEGVDTISGTD